MNVNFEGGNICISFETLWAQWIWTAIPVTEIPLLRILILYINFVMKLISLPTMWNDNTIGVLLPFHIFHISILHSVKPYGETAVEKRERKQVGKKECRNSFSRWMGYNHKVESISANTHTHRNIDGNDVFVLQQLPNRLARHVHIVGSAFVVFHPAQYTLEGNYPI